MITYKIYNQNYQWLEVNLKEKISKPLALFAPGVSKKGNYKASENKLLKTNYNKILENLNM